VKVHYDASANQGPKQLGNYIDVYLRPLVDELLLLWKKDGVHVWDENKQENFNLGALLFITINDWPTLSNLSRNSNKGYRACTHYLLKTDGIHLKICKKVVYMGHRRFLHEKHPLRKKRFALERKGWSSYKAPPFKGEEIFEKGKDLRVVFGKGEPVPHDANGCAPMWKKKSIFWELPCWEILEVRNAINVMLLMKNLCLNVLGFLGCYKNSKDTLEARRDQKNIHRNEAPPIEVDKEEADPEEVEEEEQDYLGL
jgi:hypothetical protein